jgi:two-component system OmpR family sensor kinase
VLLRNLLENAVKYAPEGGRVDIGIEPDAGGGTLLVVEDNGPGIPEEERARVFDRFYRTGQEAGPPPPAAGWAWPSSTPIAAQHGATVALGRSDRLGGLRAEVRFPALSRP